VAPSDGDRCNSTVTLARAFTLAEVDRKVLAAALNASVIDDLNNGPFRICLYNGRQSRVRNFSGAQIDATEVSVMVGKEQQVLVASKLDAAGVDASTVEAERVRCAKQWLELGTGEF
jgi:hypothetical protein